MGGVMMIDGRKVAFTNEVNILEVVRKAGIDLPTFCYHSELSLYGACRMCIVEDTKGNIFVSCSEQPRDGLEIYTSTRRLLKYRKNILELILANHDRECTSCQRTGKCKLQDLATRFNIRDIRYDRSPDKLPLDRSSLSISRNPNKCIFCGDCVRVCDEIQGVGALCFAHRGSQMKVTPAFSRDIAEVNCVNCGQCRVVCPTGAITIRNDNTKVWDILHDPQKRIVAQVAPAVRVALGEEFGMNPGEVTIGKIVGALKALGVNEVYDTSFAADLTVMEESAEFMERMKQGENLPLFTSCCPAWVKFAENKYPEMQNHISSCKSPQQMFGSVIKAYYKEEDEKEGKETVVLSIMPCTAKKSERAKPEFAVGDVSDVDIVITTEELALLIKEAGILFSYIEEESFDMPFGMASGSGVIFGSTGGVTEAVVTRLLKEKPGNSGKDIIFRDVRGLEGIKEAVFQVEDQEVGIAVVHGLKNVTELMRQIKSGEKTYHLVEVMACRGGCVAGGGQPVTGDDATRELRAKGLYQLDRRSNIKSSELNPILHPLFEGKLKGRNHELLHVHKK